MEQSEFEAFETFQDHYLNALPCGISKYRRKSCARAFEIIRERFKEGTKYRSVSTLGPLVLYLFLKSEYIGFDKGKFLSLLGMSKTEFYKELKEVIPAYPRYQNRDKSKSIIALLSYISMVTKLGDDFEVIVKVVLNDVFSRLTDKSEELITALACALGMMILDIPNDVVSINSICSTLAIQMSSLGKLFNARVASLLNIPPINQFVNDASNIVDAFLTHWERTLKPELKDKVNEILKIDLPSPKPKVKSAVKKDENPLPRDNQLPLSPQKKSKPKKRTKKTGEQPAKEKLPPQHLSKAPKKKAPSKKKEAVKQAAKSIKKTKKSKKPVPQPRPLKESQETMLLKLDLMGMSPEQMAKTIEVPLARVQSFLERSKQAVKTRLSINQKENLRKEPQEKEEVPDEYLRFAHLGKVLEEVRTKETCAECGNYIYKLTFKKKIIFACKQCSDLI